GGGCVAGGTPILTPKGYVPIQKLAIGSTLVGFNLSSGKTIDEKLLYANSTLSTDLIRINAGLLTITSADQPIYIANSSYVGWLIDPRNLTSADLIFDPVNGFWIQVWSIQHLEKPTKVYDVVTSGLNNFIGDGVLLDKKTP
ncbi:MAG: Hint domain-containing protein, partial [Thermoplasmata archaeon]